MLDELASPALAVIEDVHWADDSTVDLLRYLGRRITQTRSVLLVTFRTDEVEAHPPLRVAMGDLASAPGSRRLAVAPLSVDGVRSIAQGHPLDPVRLHEVTGGNPFYVTEVLSTGGVVRAADRVRRRAGPGVAAPRRASTRRSTSSSIEPSGMEWWLAEALGRRPGGHPISGRRRRAVRVPGHAAVPPRVGAPGDPRPGAHRPPVGASSSRARHARSDATPRPTRPDSRITPNTAGTPSRSSDGPRSPPSAPMPPAPTGRPPRTTSVPSSPTRPRSVTTDEASARCSRRCPTSS